MEATGETTAVERELAIARGLIEAQGGRIWAENRSAGGTRVGFSLPVAAAEPARLDEVRPL